MNGSQTVDTLVQARRKGRVTNAVILIVFAIVLIGVTYIVLDQMLDNEIEQVESAVTWRAQEVAWDISAYLDERRRDAIVTALQKGLPRRVLDFTSGVDPEAGVLVQDRLSIEQTHHGYRTVSIFDGSGTPLMWAGSGAEDWTALTTEITAASGLGQVRFLEYVDEGAGWQVWWFCPMPDSRDDSLVLGECVDVAPTMLDVIKRHQESFQGGEIVILDSAGDGVVRSVCVADGVRVSPRESCTGLRSIAMQLPEEERAEVLWAEDCKMGRAVGAVVTVPGTDWRVLAKTPESEVMDSVRDSHGLALGVDLMIFAVAGMTVVSLQRSHERRAEQAHSMSEIRNALASQDRFLANMSHELRTPLNSIMGFTSLMLGGMTGPLNDEQRKQLGMVDESSKRLLALVNDVLDLSKLKAGKRQVSVSEFRIGEVVADVCGIMHPLSTRKELECGFTVPDEDLVLRTDREMVERVVLNLLSNAVKFTDSGFVYLEVTHDAESDTVHFIARDSGCGMLPEDLARVMEEFMQVVEASGYKPVGTGLGLAISRRMAEALGGALLAQSELGVGSTFTFIIPRVYGGDGQADL